ncbi:hypothetical protein SP15_276 [Bacillus phage SP-15]|uniref:Uncharacterized protein n=1 Tax=Bacillus phage SP-15 TaxID=1792032 RepID=A0A127AXZ3_9CAUD|nr:hypothetical protein SP15_276 [Bacillus phage SP-15]AMM45084.1 hypothetical protein SP15_276 [Bacillus phage SP-15]
MTEQLPNNELATLLQTASEAAEVTRLKKLEESKANVDPSMHHMMDMASRASTNEGISPSEISMLLSPNNVDNMKAFLVVLARNELTRVVRLIDSMNKLEERLMQIVADDSKDMDAGQIAYIMRTLQSSLDKAMGLINKVTEDNQLNQFIINATIHNTQNNVEVNDSKVALLLKDESSRDKIRTLANGLVQGLKDPTIYQQKTEKDLAEELSERDKLNF